MTPPTDPAADAEQAAAGTDDAYGGLLGAYPYAIRRSDSWLFRGYAVLGGLLALVLSLLFLVAFLLAIAGTVGLAAGGTTAFFRAFVVFVGFLVVAPLLAPVLFVARHHRLVGDDPAYDRALAATGVGYALALYLGAVVSVPPANEQPASGAVAPVVRFLYDLPELAGLVPPVVAAALIYLVHRRYRRRETAGAPGDGR